MLMCLILWSEYKTTKLHSLPLTVPPALGQEELALMAGLWKSGPREDLGCRYRMYTALMWIFLVLTSITSLSDRRQRIR